MAAVVHPELCHCVIHNGSTNHGAGKHEWLEGDSLECSANQEAWSQGKNTEPCEHVTAAAWK